MDGNIFLKISIFDLSIRSSLVGNITNAKELELKQTRLLKFFSLSTISVSDNLIFKAIDHDFIEAPEIATAKKLV